MSDLIEDFGAAILVALDRLNEQVDVALALLEEEPCDD